MATPSSAGPVASLDDMILEGDDDYDFLGSSAVAHEVQVENLLADQVHKTFYNNLADDFNDNDLK